MFFTGVQPATNSHDEDQEKHTPSSSVPNDESKDHGTTTIDTCPQLDIEAQDLLVGSNPTSTSQTAKPSLIGMDACYFVVYFLIVLFLGSLLVMAVIALLVHVPEIFGTMWSAIKEPFSGGDEPASTTTAEVSAVTMAVTEAAKQVATVTVNAVEAAKETVTILV